METKAQLANNYAKNIETVKKYVVAIFFIFMGITLFKSDQGAIINLSNFIGFLYSIPTWVIYLGYVLCGIWIALNALRRRPINGIAITPYMVHVGAAVYASLSGIPYVSLPILGLAIYVAVDLSLMVFPVWMWKYLYNIALRRK